MIFLRNITCFLGVVLLPVVSFACNTPVLPGNAVDIRDYGAVANDGNDDTEAIQDAIDATLPGETLYIPAGTFLIDPLFKGPNQWGSIVDRMGIYPHSNMTIILDNDAVLQAIPSAEEIYCVVSLENVDNVTISGGTIKGERYGHIGTTGEHGRVLGIWSSSDIEIVNTTIADAWGDGVYMWDDTNKKTENIHFCNVTVKNSRRQGIGIVGADKVLIENSKILNTIGTSPESGINCEPNPGQQVTNVVIRNCEIAGNFGTGVRFDGVDSATYGNRLEDSVVKDNGYNGIYIDNSQDNILTRNLLENNGISTPWVAGIVLKNVQNTLVENNSLRDTLIQGDHCRGVQIVELSSGVNIHDNDICIDEETLRIDDRSTDHAFVEAENTYCARDARTDAGNAPRIKLDFLSLLLH